MAATQTGVWDLQDVRDKQLAGEWSYDAPVDPGGIYGWGNNSFGKLGDNSDIQRSSPTQVGAFNYTNFYIGDSSIAVGGDGYLWAWGRNTQGQLGHNNITQYSSPRTIGSGTDWSAASSIGDVAAAVKTDGTLWVWGRNNNGGALGQNNTTPQSSPVQVPGTWSSEIGSIVTSGTSDVSFTAVKTNGTIWTWGNGYDGQLGVDQPGGISYSSPMQIGTDTTWSDSNGHLGSPGKTGRGAIKTDGTLWMWGNAEHGTLGLNDRTNRSSPTQVPGTYTWISKGLNQHDQRGATFVIKDDSTLWAMGSLWYGQLGNNYGSAGGPTGSTVSASFISSPTQCCGTSTGWAQVSHGSLGVLATKTDGTLWAWGYGGNGQLGLNENHPSGKSSPCQIGTGTKWKLVSSNNYSSGAISN